MNKTLQIREIQIANKYVKHIFNFMIIKTGSKTPSFLQKKQLIGIYKLIPSGKSTG